jgi:hypothetical protein
MITPSQFTPTVLLKSPLSTLGKRQTIFRFPEEGSQSFSWDHYYVPLSNEAPASFTRSEESSNVPLKSPQALGVVIPSFTKESDN